MAIFNRNNTKLEFLNFLRNSDIFTTSERGVTTKTDSGTTSETGAETITLSETNAKNVRSVTYDGTQLTYGEEYTININNYQVTLLAVVPGKDYEISFDYGSSDKIYSDYPRLDLTIESYPRIGFDIYGQTSETGGFGNVNMIRFLYNINIYAKSIGNAETYMDSLRSSVVNNQNNFYYISYVKPRNVRQVEPIDVRGKNKVYMIGCDIESKNNYEIN